MCTHGAECEPSETQGMPRSPPGYREPEPLPEGWPAQTVATEPFWKPPSAAVNAHPHSVVRTPAVVGTAACGSQKSRHQPCWADSHAPHVLSPPPALHGRIRKPEDFGPRGTRPPSPHGSCRAAQEVVRKL